MKNDKYEFTMVADARESCEGDTVASGHHPRESLSAFRTQETDLRRRFSFLLERQTRIVSGSWENLDTWHMHSAVPFKHLDFKSWVLCQEAPRLRQKRVHSRSQREGPSLVLL